MTDAEYTYRYNWLMRMYKYQLEELVKGAGFETSSCRMTKGFMAEILIVAGIKDSRELMEFIPGTTYNTIREKQESIFLDRAEPEQE